MSIICKFDNFEILIGCICLCIDVMDKIYKFVLFF